MKITMREKEMTARIKRLEEELAAKDRIITFEKNTTSRQLDTFDMCKEIIDRYEEMYKEIIDKHKAIIKEFKEKLQQKPKVESAELSEELAAKDAKIEDLTDRLKIVLKMNSISNNQELITLKESIAKGIRFEYEDFYSEDMKQMEIDAGLKVNDERVAWNKLDDKQKLASFCHSSLTRIFMVLKRYKVLV